MSEALISADTRAREAALDPHRSILLQAPAGSGKTAVLTQRFLRLLCTVDEPGEILAITFTRKAAAQMRSRVISALRGEFAADDPCAAALRALAAAALAHAATRGWDLARDAGELRIQTIDSFNYWLATQLPLASRAGGALHVSETPLALYQRAARRTLGAADADAALAADDRAVVRAARQPLAQGRAAARGHAGAARPLAALRRSGTSRSCCAHASTRASPPSSVSASGTPRRSCRARCAARSKRSPGSVRSGASRNISPPGRGSPARR